ncbi:uncharacterized protein [Henckelia pumila]|uniref:uncharacterized protein isoform X2 n=1 Tax=Henckelia pumila TaxID=405737 RepID=UPI003C6DFBBD
MARSGLRLRIRENHVILENGILGVTISRPDGLVTAIKYNGIDNLLETTNEESNRGYWDLVWSSPGSPGTTGTFQVIRGTNMEIIVANEEQIELSFSAKWDTYLQGKLAPLNIDKRFVMLRGSSGFYTYAIYERLEGWPGFNLDETRVVFKLNKNKFHYMAMADNRQRPMPSSEDRLPGRGEQLAYPEAVVLVDPVEPKFKGEVDDKYQYSCEDEDLKVHGWICFNPAVGFWQISPSNEFRTGGPLKQELTSHVGPTTLAMFISAHYGGNDLVLKFEEGEPWKKVFGPVFMYLNSAKEGEDPLSLWQDAKQQVLKEVKSWPYSFPASDDFPKSVQRGSVSGRLLVKDRYISDDYIVGNGGYIGLAPPGDIGSWQTECKGYQFWTRADEDGLFAINNIRMGEYNLYAWIPGFIGDYRNDAVISISPGCNIETGDIVYEPPRHGPTLWEIGIPDRCAKEFYIPEPKPNYINKLYVNHPDRKREDKTYESSTWQIKFKLNIVKATETYKLRVALASANRADLQIRINNREQNPVLFTTGLIGGDNAIARHGIHGLYWLFNVNIEGSMLVEGDINTIYLTQANATSPFQGIMYDYIRLEGP